MGEAFRIYGREQIYKKALTKLAQKEETTWRNMGEMGEHEYTGT